LRHTALFTDNEFHNIGVSVSGAPTDLGRYEVTHTIMIAVPSRRPRYAASRDRSIMHDGSADTLVQ
jgi:hypothetical protein